MDFELRQLSNFLSTMVHSCERLLHNSFILLAIVSSPASKISSEVGRLVSCRETSEYKDPETPQY